MNASLGIMVRSLLATLMISRAFAFSPSHLHVAFPRKSLSNNNKTPSRSFSMKTNEDFTPPEPRTFYVRPDNLGNIATAAVPLVLRLGSGIFVKGYEFSLEDVVEGDEGEYNIFRAGGKKLVEKGKEMTKPQKPLEIYEFEPCPFCKKVREAVNIFDLDVIFYPCPKDGPTFRPKVMEMGGKAQFPYLIDPNTGVSMYESDDIIKYLADNYGDGEIPGSLSGGIATTLSAGLGGAFRLGKGSKYITATATESPIEVWGYEGSPFVKVVREALVELELPHLWHTTARGSKTRQELKDRTGIFQVPYIEDPNTGVKMFESKEIVDYLIQTYKTS